MTYETWRITYQSSEQATRAAYTECVRLQAKLEQTERPAPIAKVHVHQVEAGGYRDIGTDLTDDALAAIHMLGIIRKYGVDRYLPAQPAPSVPENKK